MTDRPQRFRVAWHDEGRAAENPPDPRYPNGMDIDVTGGQRPACRLRLEYPAPRVGQWLLECRSCGLRAMVTAAGRADDPRTVALPCKPRTLH